MKCLIIDDDPDFADLLVHRLQGADVTIANTRREALDILARRTPDVIILDLRLPDSDPAATMDWIGELKRSAPRAAIVVMTGDERESTRTEALLHGADRYLEKNARDCFRKVAEICAHGRRAVQCDAAGEIERRVIKMTTEPFAAPRLMRALHPVAALLRP